MLLVPLFAVRASAVDVATCGQLVPAGQVGVLQADLDCGGDEAAGACLTEAAAACASDPGCTDAACGGVLLRDGSTLAMNGHTVANGVVVCPLFHSSCSVVGPGTIVGGYGLTALGRKLDASGGLDVHGGEVGIANYKGRVILQDATVSGVANWGIQAYRGLRATNVTSNNNEIGILVYNGSFTGSGITANDNRGTGVLVAAGRLVLTGLMATGNGRDPEYRGAGVLCEGRTVLVNSVVTGNYADGTRPLDLLAKRRPVLVDSTCDHSLWGICSQD